MKMASTTELVADSVVDLTAEEKPKTFKAMTMSERCRFTRELITVEPVLCFYLMAGMVCSTALYALETYKSCVADGGIDPKICQAIVDGEHKNYTIENEIQQKFRADMHSWNSPIQNIVPMILILFLGSYSDRHRLRKPFIIIPIIGELFAMVGMILNVFFMKELPLLALGIMQNVVPSFFGGLTLFLMATYTYIADVSSLEMRTVRIGVMQIVINVCIMGGQFISAPVYTYLGYTATFTLATILYICAIVYTIFVVKEGRQPIASENKIGFFKDLLNPQHVVDTFSVLLKKTPGNNRLYLAIVMLVLLIMRGVGVGEFEILGLYTQTVFFWTPQLYSLYVASNAGWHLIGTTIGVALFTKIMNLSDYNLINLSFLNYVLSNLFFAFSHTTTMFFIATAISLFSGVNLIGIRSLSTKVVSIDNLGKAQSLFAVCEAIGPSIGSPLYNYVYTHSPTFRGAYFLVSVLLTCTCGFLILWLYILKTRRDKRKAGQEKKVDESDTNGMQMAQTTHI